MTTSNSYDYTLDRDTIIRSSFELCHIAIEGQELQTEEITVAARVLNVMIKAWAAHGLQVWKRKTYTIDPLVLNKKFYDLGVHETNTVTLTGTGTVATGTLNNHGYTTGDLYTSTGASDSNYDVTAVALTVTGVHTFTYASTGSGADSNTGGLANTHATVRPERILSIDRVDSSGNETDLTSLTRHEFDDLPNKTTAGLPVNFHYERRLGAGRVYVWPVADATAVSDYTLDITYQSPIEDVDAATSNFDFPPEWLEAITYGLATRLAPRYGVPMDERYLLRKEAKEALELASDYDVEDGSVYFGPDERR